MSRPNPTLVDIGTHSLALYTHGPQPSGPDDPVVFFISGLASSSIVWSGVLRQLPSSLRSYTYDRSGYGHSESSPLPPSAENIASELALLIDKAAVTNPLVLVGHSWAGVLISEFIVHVTSGAEGNGNGSGLYGQIAGLVLVDANHETQPLVFNVNDPMLQALTKGIEPYAAKGIEAEHKLTPEKWAAFRADESTEHYEAIAQQEIAQYDNSFETLRRKDLGKRQPLLGSRPVYIIGGKRSRDWSGLYRAAIARGNGTDEQRRYVQEMIRTADEKSAGLMHKFAELSTTSKVVFAQESGHFVQLTQPDVVADGVKWVLEQVRLASSAGQ